MALPLSTKQFDALVLVLCRDRPATLEEVMAFLHASYGAGLSLNAFWNAHWRAVPARLNRMVRDKVIGKALVKGRNYFVPGEAVAGAAARFDLTDPAARLVAADWVEGQGKDDLAGLLRKAKRWAFGNGV